MPDLIPALRDIVPFTHVALTWNNADWQALDGFADWNFPGADENYLLVLEFYQKKRFLEVFIPGSEFLQLPVITRPEQRLRVSRREYLRHDVYQHVQRPSGGHHALSLRLAQRSGLMAILVINRAVGEPDFSSEEIRVLETLCPFLSTAINHPLVDSGNHWADAEQGLLLFDRFGVLHSLDANAEKILEYALERRAQARHGLAMPFREPWLKSLLKTLVDRLDAIRGNDPNATPAVIRLYNYWGQFEFRGYFMEARYRDHQLLYAANIFRLTPLPLRLAHGVRKQDLSLRESQVALSISLGETHKQIADKLHISERTVIGHSQQIYDKLSIANRMELLALLINQRF